MSNGPALELTVDAAGVGEDLVLAEPGAVRVWARLRFDASRDDLRSIEIVHDGDIVAAEPSVIRPGEIAVDLMLPVSESGWIAARASGTSIPSGAWTGEARSKVAHTGNIRVHVDASSNMRTGEKLRSVSGTMLSRLDELESRFDADGIRATAALPQAWTGVNLEVLMAGQDRILERISSARSYFRQMERSLGSTTR